MTQTLSHADSEAEVFVLPTSFAQQRLWFLQQLMPENPAYNVPLAVQLSGELNIAALEQTFNEIVRRHESLRTNFKMIGGQPRQVVLPQLTLPLPLIDLQTLPPADQQAEVERLTIEAFQRPFDLVQDALLRVKLLQLDETNYVLLLTMHHIVTDGWSIAVLIRELEALYIAFAAGHPSPLAELPIQYADFAHWQQDWLQGEVLASQLAYWQQKLEGAAPILELPNLGEKTVVPSELHFTFSEKFQGAREALVLPKALKSAIVQLSDEANATPFMTLLAAFQTLLFRYTGQTDISVGSPIANRNHSELESLIGFFANSVVLRTDLSGNPTFLDLLNQVREVALGAYAHQDLPFEKLVEALQPDRDLNRNPLFQVVFALQNSPAESLELPKLTLSPVSVDPGTARFDLEFQIVECLDTLGVVAVYRTDLFDQAAIARMLKHFQTLLENIVAAPNQRLSDLPILTAVEQHQQLVQWNATEAEYPKDWCIHDWFESQVNQTPDAVAVVFADQQLTYRELSDRSNQLAHSLQQFGVVPDRLVGICVEQSLNMLIAVLAVLKAGGAYVPLDPTYPTERLQFMLQDAQVSILLTQRSLVDRFVELGQTVICLDQQEYRTGSNPPLSRVTANNLAYVIYTSGSTGQPKGVLVTHQGLSNLAQAQHQIFNVQPSDRVLQFASLSFDASIFEIIMALTTGATLYLIQSASRLGANLVQFLQEQHITHVTLPPALLNLLPELPDLKVVIAAGEACSSELVDRWAMRRRFFNAYGLTETSVWSTIAELKVGQTVTIGRAIANTQLYVLNSDLQPVAIGVPGELYIGGDGLAKGYLNRADLTAERFIPNPFKPDSRLYKTGDRVRYRSDGNLQFLGRMDEQVKLRGYRIELGEIETVLKQHPAIAATVVAVQVAEKTVEEKHIVACVVPNSAAPPELNSQLKAFLQQRLPAYMIPSVIAIQPTLPLLPNGKIDRQSLATLSLNTAAVAPRTETEVTLAKLWAEQLGLTEIDVTQNFFDMGGDSLKAMRLMDQIHQHFEQLAVPNGVGGAKSVGALPLSSLFLAPTIEQLAQQLDQANCSPSASEISSLVPLQPTGSKPPFFCVHPIFGTVFPYYQLAQQFSAPTDSAKRTSIAQSTLELGKANRPFYGLHPIGLEGHPPHTTIEEMAAYYIKAIRQIQPQGPYYIGGWSFGGVVAFEMAQQLEQAGHEVALLAMLDTASPGHQLSYRDNFNVLTTLTRSLLPFLIDYGCLLKSSLQTQVQTQSAQFLSSFLKSFQRQPRGDNELRAANPAEVWHSQSQLLNELSLRPILQTYRANAEAFLSYSPQRYSHPITLFKTSKTNQDSTLGWKKLTKEVNLCPIPGNHLTMLRSPHVQYLAQQLKQCMGEGQLTS
ncbi:MAG: amino acid adenylation domain-containing protein [Myxacorys californica WJT36-NPBG1]|jgi:amino acid adenylation domain-containing protein|nr:amino acid adenylation domain-containing protein [Myxacorys californica WJT36-NPBG1]